MRVFTGGIATESNSFSPVPTNLESFKERLYYEAGTHPADASPTTAPLVVLRREARKHGWELFEGITAFAEPGAPTPRPVYEALRDQLLHDLDRAMPVDFVVLGLHGAMIADGYDDCEGDQIARVRRIVGPGVPIGVELDPHCHLTPAMLEHANAIVLYKEFPHVDFVERAEELVRITAAAARREIKPVMSTFDCQMIVSMPTTRQPMRGFVDRIQALEGKGGILSISVVHCFPYGDVEEIGARILVVTDERKAEGDRLAERLGRELYALRRELAPPYQGVEEAIDYALDREGGPFVLADPADNAGGGAPSDNTTILRALLDKGVENAALGPIWDPQAVEFAFAGGEGARLRMRIGGKVGAASGQPVDAEVEVIKLAPDARQRFAGGSVPLGDAAGLRIRNGAGGVEVVVNSSRTQARSPDLFEVVGIRAREKKILVVKSTNHFHAAFAPIAKEIVYVESDGPLPRTYGRIPYTRITRPLWPMVEDPLGLDPR